MNPETPDLEAHAEGLLKRIQRHNLGFDSLTELEVHSLLKEIQAVGQLNLVGSLPEDVLARVDRIMQQAVQEARNIVAGARGHGTKNRAN